MTTKEPVLEFLYKDLEAKKVEFNSNIKKIAKLTKRNADLESDVKHLESTITRIHQHLKIDEAVVLPPIISQRETPPRKKRRKGSIADLTYALLLKEQRSMTIREITKILTENNLISTKAKNPMVSVSSALSRDDRMKADGRGNWSLRTDKDEKAKTANDQTHAVDASLDEDDEAESDVNEEQRGEKSVSSIGSDLGLL